LPRLAEESTQLQDECNALRQQESSLVDRIRELNVEIAQMKQSAQEFKSSNRLLQALMKEKSRSLPGIYGRLGDLGAIDEKYALLVLRVCFINGELL
jgi:structural maintenance of chromosome 4